MPDAPDWYTILKQDMKNWSESDYASLAVHWVTCGTGQLCKELPKNEDNSPQDETLKKLGLSFFRKVAEIQMAARMKNQKIFNILINDARIILKKMETRTIELLFS